MTRIMPLSEVKTHFPRLVDGVGRRGEEIIVTKNGRPTAVLVNYDEYENLKETLDILSDKKLMAQIRSSDRYFARGGKGYTIDEVFGKEE